LVDVFISPSQFLKNKVREVVHLPNFTSYLSLKPNYGWSDRYAVYFGRISAEKGLHTLVRAMEGSSIRLKIIGDGPLQETLEKSMSDDLKSKIDFLGHRSGDELRSVVQESMFVVLPSRACFRRPNGVYLYGW
jgi:glycosyltransferase involved in cell wall biosynthesis